MATVLIIGAGLGGLCLAHALQKHNIPFKVFEKDAKHDFRAQGYRLRIGEEGIRALQYSLTPAVWDLLKETCAEFHSSSPSGRLDAVTAIPLGVSMLGGGPPSFQGRMEPLTVDRTVFRDVLLTGLQGRVFFGKQFTHYEADPGRVRAYFTDGTVEEGALLIGADGLRSRVRKQRLPDYPILDTGIRIIYGKTVLSEQVERQLPQELHRGMSLVFENDQIAPKTLLLEPIRFLPTARAQAQTHVHIPQDYIYWVLATNRSSIPLRDGETLRLNHEQSVALSLTLTEKWHPSLRVLFEAQSTTQTSTLRISSVKPDLPDWEPSPPSARVTLLGDAVHVMPPTGGMGVNTSLRDAEDLARRVAELWAKLDCSVKADSDARLNVNSSIGIDEISALVNDYEDALRVFARQALEGSWCGGRKAFGLGSVEECDVIIDL